MRERARSINNTTDFLITPKMYAPLETSLVLRKGAGGPTWSRATKAWGFNELGYLEELASGCAFFGGARLVRNLIGATEDASSGSWLKSTNSSGAQATDSSGGSTALRFTYGSTESYLMRQIVSTASRAATYCLQMRFKTDATHDWWRAMIYDGSANQCRVWFNAQTGALGNSAPKGSGVFGSVTITDEGGGWFTLRLTGSPGVAGAGVYAEFNAADGDGSTLFSSAASGDAITIEKPSLVDVTGYDVSYVPEYVSVGVEASPFFGAGIDGAKYFSTDYTGGRGLTNLIGFRREAAATNNLLQCRNTTQNAWGSPANGGVGSELLTNGAFGSATDWTRTGAAYWSVSGGVLNLNAADSSASYYDNSQTYALLVTGKQYVVEFDYVHTSGAAPTVTLRGTDGKPLGNSTGRKTVTITCGSSVAGYGIRIGTLAAAVATIDNITIKEAPVQCSQTATGLDGIADTATTLTAGAADAIILQPTSGIASAARCASAYVKRRTGTGTISFTQDGGSTWTDISSQINSSTWSRVEITATLANPSVGFKISTSGDAIDVDCVQNEAGAVATSPIVTTTAALTRNEDSLTYQTSGNWSDTVGTAYVEVEPLAYSGGAIGSATNGLLLSTSNSGATAFDGTNAANGPTGTPGTSEKLALNWTGAVMEVASSATVGTPGTYDGAMGLSNIGIGVGASGYFKNVAVYPYALSDADMVKITT